MGRHYEIKELASSFERGQYLRKVSFRVRITEREEDRVVEVRINESILETISDPAKFIREHLDAGPLPPANAVIDLPPVPVSRKFGREKLTPSKVAHKANLDEGPLPPANALIDLPPVSASREISAESLPPNKAAHAQARLESGFAEARTANTAWTITKAAAEISKKLYDLGKLVRDRETKQQVDEILDEVRDLKHLISLLEEHNRELREKLRSKKDKFHTQGYSNAGM